MAGESSHPVVTAALLPIVAGVGLVSREASLTWGGLLFAIASSASVGESFLLVLVVVADANAADDGIVVYLTRLGALARSTPRSMVVDVTV